MITRDENFDRCHRPHFLLLADAQESGRWQFSLEPLEDGDAIEVSDLDPELSGERLELLTVIRGLEALDQPSRVTLVTSSRYVARGIRYDIEAWRQGEWQWERFGRMVPIKNEDLWRRLDAAMHVHEVRCKHYRMDSAHVEDVTPAQPSRKRQVRNPPHFQLSEERQASRKRKARPLAADPPRTPQPASRRAPSGGSVLRALPILVRELMRPPGSLARSS